MTALSVRDHMLLSYVAVNASHEQIAADMGLDVELVGEQILALFDALNVSNRADAVAIARARHGFGLGVAA